MMPPPSVQTTPTGDAEYTTARQAPAAPPPCVIQQNPDGTFMAQCGDKPPTPLKSFDDLVTYLKSEFAPADGSPAAGSDVSVDQAGATAQA